ncbi:tegument phosphoprotein UL35 [Cynomolgus macaque cytomegalovirus strain Ottawa]|uniref:Tegument phosphoprotein UL35 n=1 Tax=macacine betaherpesvirus 8 TaxID=2560567 RepID=G8H159_9BETA|nr:tegument phosphoprotein UL35 [Cynomolgus macaque cytomegalovirus strain Ottawa]AEQ32133.1 tegument phosphoprotein UL35 [Cynomolgus macaque cytomegalovirus strain Ottawa]
MSLPPSIPALPVDASLNLRPDLFSDEHRRLLVDILTQGCGGYVGLLCYGLPMPSYVLETLIDFQIKTVYTKIKQIANSVIRICILANYLKNSQDLLVDLQANLDEINSGANKQRLYRGLHRICRQTNMMDVYRNVSQLLDAGDVTMGVYRQGLAQMRALTEALDLHREPNLQPLYETLTSYNLLYLPPPYLSAAAVEIYSENLGDLTKRINRSFNLQTQINRSKRADYVVNDVLFLLSARHLQFRHRLELQILETWIVNKCNYLCNDLYFAYVQVPECRGTFCNFVSGLQVVRKERHPTFRPLLHNLCSLLNTFHEANVYLCPQYLHSAIFLLLRRVSRVREGDSSDSDSENQEAAEDRDTLLRRFREGDLDLEVDPTSTPLQNFYFAKNPFGNSEIFRIPEQASRYLRRNAWIDRSNLTYISYKLHNGTLSEESFPMRNLYSLIMEGASRQAGTNARQFMAALQQAPLGHDEPEAADHSDLFADVDIRPAQPSSGSSASLSTPSTSSAPSGQPSPSRLGPEQPPRQRRYLSLSNFSPYSVARHHHRRRRPRPPRGPAHTSRQGPDIAASASASGGEDPRDSLAEELEQL